MPTERGNPGARCPAILTLLLMLLAPLPGWAEDAGGSLPQWQRYRDTVTQDPSLLRYYTFETVPVPDLAGKGGALQFELVPKAGAPPETLRVIEGRWPGKQAVRLDQGTFAAEPFPVAKAFTAAAWVRTHGPGVHRGNNDSTDGTLLSIGVGYWDGWRVTVRFPSGQLGFEIGRPAPVNAVGISGEAPLRDGIWHHLACTWDGRQMCLYLDGLLIGQGDYAGDYTPPAPTGRFRVGYANSGWGSAVLDVDEVAIYSRALAPMEILQAAHFYAPLGDAVASRFAGALAHLSAREHAAAARAFAGVLRQTDLHPHLRAVARLCRGRALQAQRDLRAAAGEWSVLLELPGLPDRHRRAALDHLLQLFRQGAGDVVPRALYEKVLALPEITPSDRLAVRLATARSYRREGQHALAWQEYERLIAMPDLSPRQQLDLQLERAHARMEARDYRAARTEYARIAALAEAPAHYRSAARLQIAESYLRAREWRAAAAELRQLQEMADAPEHHRWEAAERLREVQRLQAGRPPRHPADSRVRVPRFPKPAITFYVSPRGSDTNPGTKARPFATLVGAREAIRALKRQGPLPHGGVVVFLRGGEYRLTKTFTLTEEDSGTAEAPVVYRAFPGETPVLTGGTRVRGFQPVHDAAVLARLPEEARGKVVQCDLRAQGITEYGTLQPRGFGMEGCPVLELFFDGRPMRLARWPNEGFLLTGQVRDPGSQEKNRGATFTYEGDRPARWSQARDIWMFGTWYYHWADTTVGVAAIDTSARQVTAAHPAAYRTREGQRFYFFNLLEEIDQPGEWYLDRGRGILYFYPPADPDRATVEISLLETPLVRLEDVSHVTLRGLTLELGRWDGITIQDGRRCLLAGCTLRRLGGNGVVIDGGQEHGILGCDLYTLGRGGTVVTGGDRKTLTPGGHFVENCHIHDFSRVDRTYTPAVLMNGVGNRIAHNLFHDSPHHGIRLEGNDHVVEFNEIHSVVYESDDQAGIDMFLNPSYRGNVLRYNYWHHIGSGLDTIGQGGIRLDDAISGTVVYGNVFYRCSAGLFGAVQIHGGKENVVDNNLFIDCRYAVSFSPWGEAHWREFLQQPHLVKLLHEDVEISRPPYSTRYPALARLAEQPDVNSVWRNVVYNCGEFLTRDGGRQDLRDNWITHEDPGLVSRERHDFRLKADSPAFDRIGFRPIPFDEIGLYQDEYRASWPVRHEVTEHYHGER